MRESLVRHIEAKGNRWALWVPDGLKFSGAVVGNPGMKKGRWIYTDGSTWTTR